MNSYGVRRAERLEPSCEVVGRHKVRQMCSELVVAFIMEALDGRVLDGAFIRSTWPLVHGWLVLVSLCPIPSASQIMSKRIGRD